MKIKRGDPPTQRQADILEYILCQIEEYGRPPTIFEICHRFGFASPNAAASHLRSMARRGLVEIGGGKPVRPLGYRFKRIPDDNYTCEQITGIKDEPVSR